MRQVKVVNMTSLFSKDMMIYSFFDIRLQSPLRVIAMFYFILLFFFVGVPVLYIFWPPNVYSSMFALGISGGGAYAMSKPIWNGKSFLSFIKTQIKYLIRPKVIYDWKARPKNTVYQVENNITISRHNDYNKLYQIVKEEEELKYG